MKLLSNKCPKCLKGDIFRRFLTMNKSCPDCGHVFEREPGYFTGAMFLDCIFLPLSAIPTMAIFSYNGAYIAGGVFSLLQIIIISPIVFHFSRLLWIQMGDRFESADK